MNAATPPGEMHLAFFFFPMGRLEGAWRRPTSNADALWGLDIPIRMARQAEDSKFDAIFIGDFVQPFDLPHRPQEGGGFEPIGLLGALSATTRRIGLIGTMSTTFFEPYDVARFFAGIDHLSNGRAGWNIVTSVSGGQHYGIELPPKGERYRRAAEHVAASKLFWDAWADDAVVRDSGSGIWADPARVGTIDFHGEFYELTGAGPLCSHRSPQGWPVLVQAGQSAEGIDFAASHAEVIFTSQNDMARALQFAERIRATAAGAGRDPGSIKILPGLVPLVGRTEVEAREMLSECDALVNLEGGRRRLALDMLRADLNDLELDEPIPLERLPSPDVIEQGAGQDHFATSRYLNYYSIVRNGAMTLRELILERERGGGHLVLVGTAADVADEMARWFSARACDGFMVNFPYLPEPLDAVCSELVPELQRRRVFRTDYTGSTLREHFGLSRPASSRRV